MREDAKAVDDRTRAITGFHRKLAEQEGKPGRDGVMTELAGIQAEQGRSLLVGKRYAEAEPILRECLAFREKFIPDHWLRFNAMSMLGGALLGQVKNAEAEPLLLQGYEGMKQREGAIPAPGKPRLTEAVERIVRLYEATGRPEKAREWRTKLPPELAPPPRPAGREQP
jgi:hypothetical protein